jgi:TonB family protein
MKFIFIGIFLLSVNISFANAHIFAIQKEGIEETDKAETKVQLSYDISKLGKPTNIKVVESTDEKFNQKAIEELEKLKLEPKELNEIKIIQKNKKTEIIFIDYSRSPGEVLKNGRSKLRPLAEL